MSFEEHLINLVREDAFLYNTKCKSYKNVLKRNSRWEEIGKQLNRTAKECKQRWRSLRDRYVREKRKMNLPSGSGTIPTMVKWDLFDSLEFLNSSLQTRTQVGHYDSIEGMSSTPDPLSPPDLEEFTFKRETSDFPTPKRKLARKGTTDADEAFTHFLKDVSGSIKSAMAKQETDFDDEYMLCMSKMMKPLPVAVKIGLRDEICRRISEELLKHVNKS